MQGESQKMSLGIIIGSDDQDTSNLEHTIKVLKFTKNILQDSLIAAPGKEVFDTERLDTIITWYTGIHTLLTDPSAFPVYESDKDLDT